MRRSNRRVHVAAAIVGMAVLIGLQIAAVAADGFTDVPDTNAFHGDIGWLADAGVTLGCNPPANDQFCPSNGVTREQMAAFMHRLRPISMLRTARLPRRTTPTPSTACTPPTSCAGLRTQWGTCGHVTRRTPHMTQWRCVTMSRNRRVERSPSFGPPSGNTSSPLRASAVSPSSVGTSRSRRMGFSLRSARPMDGATGST